MGTSQSMPTPRGGRWTGVKGGISDFLSGGGGGVTAQQIVGSTINAAGGLPVPSAVGPNRGGRAAAGTGGGGGSGGGRRTRGGGRGSSVGRAVSGLAGFGATLGAGNLAQALERLGIEDLRGKPAGEVIGRIADHLADGLHGLEQEVLRRAVQDAICNAAELTGDPTYENLEASLQTFLAREGIEGLVELFLTEYVFARVWLLIEDYVSKRTDNANDVSNMELAVEQACRANVHDEIGQHKEDGSFDKQDWFGRDGLRVAEILVSGLETRLRAQGAVQ